MASAGTMRRIVSASLFLFIGMVRTLLLLLSLTFQVLMSGKDVLKPRERSKEPECLRDPALGTHEFAVLEDVTLHYVSAGRQDKPLVLLLHGFPDCWFSWKHQILGLKSDFWLVVPDLRGYGQSSKPTRVEDYCIPKLIEDIRGLVTSLGRDKATFVGHDWGALLAWAFANKHEKMVEKLVAINGPHPLAMEHQLLHSLDQIIKSWYFVAFQLPCFPEALFRGNDLQTLDRVHACYDEEEREALKYVFGKPGALTGPVNYYRASFCKRTSGNASKLRRLGVQALVVWGRRDSALTEALAALSLDYAAGGRVEYVTDAGHWVHREQPQLVNEHIKHFLLEEN